MLHAHSASEALVGSAWQNTRLESTTWEWRRVKIRRPAGGQTDQPPKASFWRRFPRRDAREPITISMKLRGGPECWIEVHARGSIGRYPGSTALWDVLADINNTAR